MLEAGCIMSTLLAAAQPATSPGGAIAQDSWALLLGALGCLGMGAIALSVAAYFLGAFRRGGIQSPPRLAPGQPVWPLPVALVAGLVFLFVGGGLVALAHSASGGLEALEESVRPPSAIGAEEEDPAAKTVKMMQQSAAAYVFATAGVFLALGVARAAGWKGRIGLSLGQMPRGVLHGALALLLVIPWMLVAGVLLGVVRKALGYPPDAMHEIIRAIRDHPQPELIAWGVVTAVVVAPLAEEVLFRGFLQTSLVHGLARLFGAGQAAPEAPPVLEAPPPQLAAYIAPGEQIHELPYMPAPVPAPPVRYPPAAKFRWMGIALTSLMFAALHEPWSIPLIFLLAVGLGYLYERTGNLWTSITVHWGFNSFNLLVVLVFLR